MVCDSDFLVWGHIYPFFFKCFSVEKVLTKRGGADLSRTSRKDESTDDLTRLKHNITDDPASSSNKNKRIDDLANSWKNNKRTCYVEERNWIHWFQVC